MKRVILRAELSPQAKTGLERVCDQRGMTQVSVMSRLVLWFAQQETSIQRSILSGENSNNDPADALMKDLLRRLGGG
jgi:hypothetical protein